MRPVFFCYFAFEGGKEKINIDISILYCINKGVVYTTMDGPRPFSRRSEECCYL